MMNINEARQTSNDAIRYWYWNKKINSFSNFAAVSIAEIESRYPFLCSVESIDERVELLEDYASRNAEPIIAAQPKKERLDIWSCGGGTQSAAIAALIVQGRLPKPDIAVMVDTGHEKSSTWEYANRVLIPNLASVGVELRIIKKDDYYKGGLYFTSQEGKETLLLPVFTNLSGEVGKVGNFCSGIWKRDTIKAYLRSINIKSCRVWIGISADEMQRVAASRTNWLQNCYPFLEAEFELYLRKSGCIQIVRDMGWDDAPKSACYFCANMSDLEWLDLKTNHPADFALAVAYEREFREKDANFYLHKSCVPLDEVDFTAPEVDTLFGKSGGCASGYCFI